ncbi:hypothetical protein A9Q87_13740 [Flavobacteriales bacterium 34_180_T64]|nr:hypothetical protein A9Q87_13740 [Flavobacteriales bacterium 34_180_T64]
MRENFLHYIWKHKKFDVVNLRTTQLQSITLVTVGQHNPNSGPDFFNAKLKIDQQLWAGNVEIHVKSSDWYLHHHEKDSAYDNVILHVVYEHDTEIFRKDNSTIPTLEIKGYIDVRLVNSYEKLFSKGEKWINCAQDFNEVDDLILNNWLERMYIERLEQKSDLVETLLHNSNNDLEATLFKLIAKNFGLKVNGAAFYSLSKSIDFSVVRKIRTNPVELEALFFGQARLLEREIQNDYYLKLLKKYKYLRQKFHLSNSQVVPFQFFRLRPANFPTIRLSQLATLYHKEKHVLSKVIEAKCLEDFYELFKVEATSFWKDHYTFDKISKTSHKITTKAFIDLLIINSILPIKFCYAKQKGLDTNDHIFTIIKEVSSEKNTIVSAFNKLKPITNSALESQALIQLKTEYCDKNRCLQCVIGNALITK